MHKELFNTKLESFISTDWKLLYMNAPLVPLDDLELPFTFDEVHAAVKDLPRDKSP